LEDLITGSTKCTFTSNVNAHVNSTDANANANVNGADVNVRGFNANANVSAATTKSSAGKFTILGAG
jgi:hypothetical protein